MVAQPQFFEETGDRLRTEIPFLFAFLIRKLAAHSLKPTFEIPRFSS